MGNINQLVTGGVPPCTGSVETLVVLFSLEQIHDIPRWAAGSPTLRVRPSGCPTDRNRDPVAKRRRFFFPQKIYNGSRNGCEGCCTPPFDG